MNRETSSLVSIETIKTIIKEELGVNIYRHDTRSYTYYASKKDNIYISESTDFMNYRKAWFVEFSKETKSGVDLEIRNHYVKTEKQLIDLIKKFKKVRKLIWVKLKAILSM